MSNGTRLGVQKAGIPSEWSPISSLPVIALVGMCVGGCGAVESGKSPPLTLASNMNPNQPDRNDAISPSATSPQTSVDFSRFSAREGSATSATAGWLAFSGNFGHCGQVVFNS
jgi:hypothetical protein